MKKLFLFLLLSIPFLVCPRAQAYDIGETGTAGTLDSADANYFIGLKVYISTPTVVVSSISAWVETTGATGTLCMCVYNSLDGDGGPGTLISASSGTVVVSNTSEAWLGPTINLTLTGPATYWISMNNNQNAIDPMYYSGGPAYSGWIVASQAFSSYPPSTAPGSGSTGADYCMKMSYTIPGSGSTKYTLGQIINTQ